MMAWDNLHGAHAAIYTSGNGEQISGLSGSDISIGGAPLGDSAVSRACINATPIGRSAVSCASIYTTPLGRSACAGHAQVTPAIIALRKAGVLHEVMEYAHDVSASSFGLEAAEKLNLPPAAVFKTLVADAEGVGLVCALVPVAGTLGLKALADAIGARKARMADAADAERTTGYVLGGISPLGQRKQLRTVIDASALSFERVYVSAGRRGLQLALAPMDLIRLTGAKTGEIGRG